MITQQTKDFIKEWGLERTTTHLINTIKQLEIIYCKTKKSSTKERIEVLRNDLKMIEV